MNRYKPVLVVLTGLAAFAAFLYLSAPGLTEKPASTAPSTTAGADAALAQQEPPPPTAPAPSLFPGAEIQQPAARNTWPAMTEQDATTAADDPRLEALLTEMANLLPELEDLLRYINMTDVAYTSQSTYDMQTYQPQIDKLQEKFARLAQQAAALSKPRTQHFLWKKLLDHGLDSEINYIILNELAAPDEPLFKEMLGAIANTGYPPEGREIMIYYTLFPGEMPEAGEELPPQQALTKAFIEEQLQLETNGSLMIAYLEAYSTLMAFLPEGEQEFRQHLDAARLRMNPDEYFGFKLQQLELDNPKADFARLLNEIDTTPMSADQRENLLNRLQIQVSVTMQEYLYNPDAPEENPIPENNRRLLLGYLENNLGAPPALQQADEYELYQYAEKAWAVELLRSGKQAGEGLYQRIANSASFDEQVALLLVIPGVEGNLPERLQNLPSLKQGLLRSLADPQYSAEEHQIIGMALNNLTSNRPPPQMYQQPYPGETLNEYPYYPATEAYSGQPAEQYQDY